MVIQNISGDIDEQDILNMFLPFAVQTKSNIVGSHLSRPRTLAFVDYDSVDPVMAALKEHEMVPFEFNGKILEVAQKTAGTKYKQNRRTKKKKGKTEKNFKTTESDRVEDAEWAGASSMGGREEGGGEKVCE